MVQAFNDLMGFLNKAVEFFTTNRPDMLPPLESLMFLAGIFAAFVGLFVIVPFIVMGCKLELRDFIYNIFASLTVGFFSIILIVYFLSAFKIMNMLSMITTIVLVIIGVLFTVYRKRTLGQIKNSVEFFYLSMRGIYKRKLVVKALFKRIITTIFNFFRQIAMHPLSLICFLLGSGGAFYIRAYHAMTEMYFGLSDVYVQTQWVSIMLGHKYTPQNIFPDGVYPFGMHAVVGSLVSIFKFNIQMAMRFSGVIFGMLIVWALYFLLSRMFKSKAAVNIGFLIYCFLEIVGPGAYFRQAHALPQELAIVFLFPCGIFFHEYMQKKKLSDLTFFAMAFGLMIAIHFYVAIVGIFLVLAILLVNIRQVFKKKVILDLVVAGTLCFLLTAGPLIGYAFFYPEPFRDTPNGKKGWEPSIGWALGLINPGGGEEAPEDPEQGIADNEGTTQSTGESLSDADMESDTVSGGFFTKLRLEYKNIPNTQGENNRNLFLYSIAGGLGMMIFGALMWIFKRQRAYGKMLIGFGLFGLMALALNTFTLLGLPEIIQHDRLYIYFCYNFGFLFLIPVEMVLFPITAFRPMRFIKPIFDIAVVVVLVSIGAKMPFQKPAFNNQYQYNGAVLSYYKIVENFEDYKWTIVSPVDELGSIRMNGWHMELCEFIYKQAEHEKIHIPSDNVFFFIEKRPLKWNRVRWPLAMPRYGPEEPVSAEYAAEPILPLRHEVRNQPSVIYMEPEYRKVVESKAYYWIEEYKKFFPREVTLFHEDNDIIVYRISQEDPYSLYNFQLPYGFDEPEFIPPQIQ